MTCKLCGVVKCVLNNVSGCPTEMWSKFFIIWYLVGNYMFVLLICWYSTWVISVNTEIFFLNVDRSITTVNTGGNFKYVFCLVICMCVRVDMMCVRKNTRKLRFSKWIRIHYCRDGEGFQGQQEGTQTLYEVPAGMARRAPLENVFSLRCKSVYENRRILGRSTHAFQG